MRYSTYEVWVRVGNRGGPVEPRDKQPLRTLGEAMSLASEYVEETDEVIIVEKKLVRRIQGRQKKADFRVQAGLDGGAPPPEAESK